MQRPKGPANMTRLASAPKSSRKCQLKLRDTICTTKLVGIQKGTVLCVCWACGATGPLTRCWGPCMQLQALGETIWPYVAELEMHAAYHGAIPAQENFSHTARKEDGQCSQQLVCTSGKGRLPESSPAGEQINGRGVTGGRDTCTDSSSSLGTRIYLRSFPNPHYNNKGSFLYINPQGQRMEEETAT